MFHHHGEEAGITVDITNAGDQPGSYTVALRINSVVIETKENYSRSRAKHKRYHSRQKR
jgi:hypothetical protein